MKKLSESITLRQRHFRSINLERDFDSFESVKQYIPTSRSVEAMNRIFRAYVKPGTTRCWSITGLYGTGKSAFANFFTALCAGMASRVRKEALSVLKNLEIDKMEPWRAFEEVFPRRGLLRAVTAAQREPIANTIIRALHKGAAEYWRIGTKPDIFSQIERLYEKSFEKLLGKDQKVLKLIIQTAKKTEGGILLVIDELGKNFEYATESEVESDLYLLQKITELPTQEPAPKILMLGLLHQSFAGYSSKLNIVQKSKWAKIQERFEDISFRDSKERVFNLIGKTINNTGDKDLQQRLNNWETAWLSYLNRKSINYRWNNGQLRKIYPLHPFTGQVLPTLCRKFAQNERTLFSFLSGSGSGSLSSFLDRHAFTVDDEKAALPSLKLHQLYDYFVETVGIAAHTNRHKWLEIQNRMLEAVHQSSDETKALKTVGILNLAGEFKATRENVVLALIDNPDDDSEKERWEDAINLLFKNSFLIHRKRTDEIRIWEGSEFNVEEAVQVKILELAKTPHTRVLNQIYPLTPTIVHRHSYQTGTLRYFECQYADSKTDMDHIQCNDPTCDGKILYWADSFHRIPRIPSITIEGKPVVFIASKDFESFLQSFLDYVALKKIESESSQLAVDGVARKEVRQRLMESKRWLNQIFNRLFNVSSQSVFCWIENERKSFNSESEFNKALSKIMDRFYSKGLTCWNELVNRRKLTPNSVKARRELMEAMLESEALENLRLRGHGPTVNIYRSLLLKNGIHQKLDGGWQFTDPFHHSGVYYIWQEISRFLMAESIKKSPLSVLINRLQSVPYGMKSGPIPILLTAALLKHRDAVGLYYKDGLIPKIDAENLDFLCRFPERFCVRFFNLTSSNSLILEAISEVLDSLSIHHPEPVKQSVSGLVAFLTDFMGTLPEFTLKTEKLSPQARRARQAILGMKEPDELLFSELPEACGFGDGELNTLDSQRIRRFKSRLLSAMLELKNAYPDLLKKCKICMINHFTGSGDDKKFRQFLRLRATSLHGIVTENPIRSLISAIIDDKVCDEVWLESLLMIIADKPVKNWKDEDYSVFQSNLTDISKSFSYFEAILPPISSAEAGDFESIRLTLTQPDGHEINEMIHFDSSKKEKATQLVETILKTDDFESNINFQAAFAVTLMQKLFSEKEKRSI